MKKPIKKCKHYFVCKKCESCKYYGKGECNFFKCYARKYSDWEPITKPNNNNYKRMNIINNLGTILAYLLLILALIILFLYSL